MVVHDGEGEDADAAEAFTFAEEGDEVVFFGGAEYGAFVDDAGEAVIEGAGPVVGKLETTRTHGRKKEEGRHRVKPIKDLALYILRLEMRDSRGPKGKPDPSLTPADDLIWGPSLGLAAAQAVFGLQQLTEALSASRVPRPPSFGSGVAGWRAILYKPREPLP